MAVGRRRLHRQRLFGRQVEPPVAPCSNPNRRSTTARRKWWPPAIGPVIGTDFAQSPKLLPQVRLQAREGIDLSAVQGGHLLRSVRASHFPTAHTAPTTRDNLRRLTCVYIQNRITVQSLDFAPFVAASGSARPVPGDHSLRVGGGR
ncbi:MAG: hypothetical protein MZV70_29650 [Desulfobacterales bacterium]|nr:hypothetical protein [Desulfobacterales bacterium]